MNKTEFDTIYREVLAEVKPILIREIQLHVHDIVHRPYPELIPKTQVIDELQKLFLDVVDKIFTESVRAANITVQKYHERINL
ncbi:hypothetical protein [Pelotomaculum propionicicum]|uniref:Uncharacterized protein n=1 Tax=Pelotomaculum propionicicum TaxID=258475 RepID=A0A4Y7RPQ6_9FIRM|nr:hypothetical protein [Pelotomaculum propionicicum]TEB10652.1 hypothetical protein Pmgp_02232 [Pelotomaculum propionicicum]